jgi:hypothetical protein
VISPLQTLSGEKPSPTPQLDVVLQLLLTLSSRPRWLVLFLHVHEEGELQSHQLVCKVGLDHLPTLVLSMVGAQWTIHNWTEGPFVPLRVKLRVYRTFLHAWLHVFVTCPMKHLRQLL